ncbi:carboxyltransferase domain-containing protein [Pseudogemmobacter sonorensis]|uniref:5-oxoprolinase subunit B/C family protein n=1 Tax=Pseudogemmobacter sonorensis TaxID=2989681 RepID=UPI00367371D7
MSLRFLPVSPRALLVELPDLERVLALHQALTRDPVAGLAETIPAARTLMIRTLPGHPADGALAAAVAARLPEDGSARLTPTGPPIEIPLRYDGEDLPGVAALMGLSTTEVIAAHQDTVWQVGFCGFAPGFAYMTCADPRFDLPRHPSPRTRIPTGSVALAARFCGIYPQDTPGGWQLIGTTPVPMWDMRRAPPALLAPGMRVRFVAHRAGLRPSARLPEARQPEPAPAPQTPALTIRATAFPLLFQDEGRAGQASQGISGSGALDLGALRRANRAVGNPSGAAALEVTLGPLWLRAERAVTLALSGAAGRIEILAPQGPLSAPPGQAFALDPGEELLVHPPERGMRSYLALRGGFRVARVLGSAARDTLAMIGPDPLGAGAGLVAGELATLATSDPGPGPLLPRPGDLVELPVTLGPRADWLAPDQIERFLATEWRVSPQSSRVGIRLSADRPLTLARKDELPSEATEAGAVQLPHSGQPVLFLADHPLTGGYPVIATLLPRALDLAGQIPPGARIRFTAERVFAPIQPTGGPA